MGIIIDKKKRNLKISIYIIQCFPLFNRNAPPKSILSFQSLRDKRFIEAKYRNHSLIKDNDGIILYGLKDTPGYIVCKEMDDYGLSQRGDTSLYRIPALTYFYLVGKATKQWLLCYISQQIVLTIETQRFRTIRINARV